MADSGVFRRSSREARVFRALAMALCVLGVLARLWPAAAALGLVLAAAVVLAVAVMLWRLRGSTRDRSFPSGLRPGGTCFEQPMPRVDQSCSADARDGSSDFDTDQSRSAA